MKKILLIDDSPDLVSLTVMRLKYAGYEAISAEDGEEGLEKALAEKPDLILLDILMPKLDGLQTLAKLKESDQTKSIPVIMLTAEGQSEQVTKAAKAGARDYIVKPYDSAVLMEKIKQGLS